VRHASFLMFLVVAVLVACLLALPTWIVYSWLGY
jgi:hypothetical protein